MAEIEIDGRQIEVPDGSTVMEAAHRLGIFVPHFCYHKKLSIAANCRMCLVQVEKAPKPLPACATPVTQGMKVWTHSDQAVQAQKGVMEFLLINHPLDCPICDQGGECQLQDLAVGYGGSSSRYEEDKRVVANKSLGPLISTDMTRCIHCTRCVRFGQEIAGIMELGMIGRGEHSEIITFVGKTVDSELSGNAIDLCPVGALTSKPFRYSARTWELVRRKSVSPHCGLGSNLTLQVKQNRVMRVLPRENESINECWISDKDRFSYEGLNSEDRLVRPMIKRDGQWQEVDWQSALEFTASGLKRVREAHGDGATAMLATPHQTLEELYLLGKLARGMAAGNVESRLRQSDFRAEERRTGVPWLGMSIAELSTLDRVLVVGSTLRKDHPLVAHRLRQAAKKRLQVNLINPVDDDLLMRVANKSIVAPADLIGELAGVLRALASLNGAEVPLGCSNVRVSEAARLIAESLASGKAVAVLLGNIAEHHPAASELQALAQAIAERCGAKFGFLGEAANSVGVYLAGATQNGANAGQLLSGSHKAYVLLGVEPELDCHDPAQAMKAMRSAEFVVALSSFQHKALDYAHVLLPIAPFTESSGTFVNTEGRAQTMTAVVQPLGDTRPGWKVLRVLGNLLGLDGFDQDNTDAIRREVLPDGESGIATKLSNAFRGTNPIEAVAPNTGRLQRIGEVPIYFGDALVRRAKSLQATADAAPPVAYMNGATLARCGLESGNAARVTQDEGSAVVDVAQDDRLPSGCIRLASGHPLTDALGAMFGAINAERVEHQARMTG